MASCPSNREEIIELAQLEVLGALEGVDGARLERLFRDALPVVQREVIDLQASMAVQSLLLPMIEPERSLRLRVLASVAQAVEATDAQLAPIALIGRPSAAGRTMATTDESTSSAASETLPAIVDGRWRRSARLWRVGFITAIGCLAATLVILVATARSVARIGELALQNSSSDELKDLTGTGRKSLKAVLEEGCIVKGLVGATARDNGCAFVALTPNFEEVRIVWVDLPRGQTLSLHAVDRVSGATRLVGDFTVELPLSGTCRSLEKGAANANTDWRLLDERGSVVFATRPTN